MQSMVEGGAPRTGPSTYPAVARATNRVGISTGGIPGVKLWGSAIMRTISRTKADLS